MIRIIEVLESVRDALNSELWAYLFSANEAYRPIFERADLENLVITAVPRRKKTEIFSRSQNQSEISIDISIAKNITSDTEIPFLISLCEDIEEYFLRKQIDVVSGKAVCEKTEYEPLYSAEHIEEQNQFAGLITLIWLSQ